MGKKSESTTRTVYSNTTTKNPYAFAKTDNSGTVAGFQDGALNSVYQFVNKNIESLLDEYINPTLNSTTNQAKLNSFINTLNQQTSANLENNIINPLSKRNMIRSSQANDLYRNLASQNVSAVSDYANNLLSSSQENTAKMLANLFSYYMQGANYLADMQKQSLQTSSGNASTYTNGDGNNSELLSKAAAMAIAAMSAL
jgi:hypothetical protein